MKRYWMVLAVGLALATPVASAEPAAASESQGGASSLLVNALRSLSALLPKPQAPATENAPVATLGIRGSETTTTLLSPYWKDDRTENPTFAAELEAYTAAQGLLQEQRWAEARAAMTKFMADHPQSDLVANARFGEAVAAAGADQASEAVDHFRQFASDYPDHPLRAEAEKLAAALAGK